MTQPRMRISATVLDAPDARALASFYERLLGWDRITDEPGWVMLRPPSGGTGLSFQSEPNFVPPVWPSVKDEQQMMTHLDIAVEDLEAGVAWALSAGARLADFQPQQHVRVMLDPVGHPFCLFPGPV
ncbi:MAG: VOC family protein [Chloroflexi bacterium]|nr:VOC family protein [Chloroflexota bacterium]